MVLNVTTLISELAQTSYAIADSPWVSSTQLSRSHSVNVQILPDINNFQFPEESDSVTLILQSPHGKVSQEVTLVKSNAVSNVATSTIVDQSLFEAGSASTTEALFYTFTDVPEGGTVSVSALFTSGTQQYVMGFAKLSDITNLNSPTVAFRIRNNFV